MSVAADARDLERRLGFAYLSVFALVLVIFVGAVHLAFALDFRHEESARIDTLLAQSLGAYEAGRGALTIDTDTAQITDPHREGVAWYDAAGRLRAQAGIVPDRSARPVAGTERHTNTLWSRVAASPYGFVRVAIVPTGDVRGLQRDDIGLGIGLFVALIAAGFGGRYLAARAIVRIAASMRTLRDFTADAAHEL
ncbi:MAG: hypothetical protein M3R44_04150, partial [Candidatus Eremiobacteraeota bacterium]|nr:hypothetical protein [Candidatus Eremiobacteraeota bacterium]